MRKETEGSAVSQTAHLRVRGGTAHSCKYLIDLGQRNASIIRRPQTPLKRLWHLGDSFAVLEPGGYDLIHTVNAVPILTTVPFVISFEDFLPKVPDDYYIGWIEQALLHRLTSGKCQRLMAWSEYGKRQFLWQHRKFSDLGHLEAKLEVVYPAARQYRSEPKNLVGDTLRLLFVGYDFMRKGGPALVRAHQQLLKLGVPVETTVVSMLRWSEDDYIGPMDRAIYEDEVARLKASTITHITSLSHDQVLSQIDTSDFLVFPTLHDTFGYVGVEALSCGTPVIATDTCAQPEIIQNGVSGYLLPFENDAVIGKWRWIYQQQHPEYDALYLKTIESLADSIVRRLAELWRRPTDYRDLSAGAVEQFTRRFEREKARDRLEQIYAEATA